MSLRAFAVLVLAGVSLPVSAHDCAECADTASVSFWSSDWNLSWYAGLSYQFSEFKDWSISRIDSGSFTSRNEDDRDGGYRLTAGMEFLNYFGVEASYADFGEAAFSGQSDGSGAFFAPGPQQDSLALDGYALHLIARVPIGGAFWVAGKAGWWQWQSRQRSSGTVYSPGPTPYSLNNSDDGIRFSWGAGLDYDGFKPVRISVEYGAATFEAPNTVDLFGASDISSLGVSLKYLF
jgi:hypothetical protein